jgi:anti-anti-sigma regulatory factor
MSSPSWKFENGGLVITLTRTGMDAAVTWAGESDTRNPGAFLNPLMSRLAKELAGLSVTIDFSGLTYMNSATVAPLITCIKSFDSSAASVLVSFSDMDWQRTHVQCVRTISRTLKKVRIEVKATGGSSDHTTKPTT